MELSACPWCGVDLAPAPDRSAIKAANFCASCDNPLFWPRQQSRGIAAPTTGATAFDLALPLEERWARERQPGEGGQESSTALPCWHCAELNPATATRCRVCDSALPQPPPEPLKTKAKPCSAPSGAIARRIIEPPTWLLVTLGVVLVVLSTWLVVWALS